MFASLTDSEDLTDPDTESEGAIVKNKGAVDRMMRFSSVGIELSRARRSRARGGQNGKYSMLHNATCKCLSPVASKPFSVAMVPSPP